MHPAFETFPFLFPVQNGHVEVQKLTVGFAALYWAWSGRVVCAGRGPLAESVYVQGHRPVRLPLLTPGTADQQRSYSGLLGLGRGQRGPGAGFVARVRPWRAWWNFTM